MRAWLILTRPWVCLSTGAIVFASHLSFGGSTQSAAGFLAVLGAILVAAAGATTNDLFDLEIDRIGHPNRPLASGVLSRRSATIFAAASYAAALALFLLVGPAIFAAGLLWSLVLILYSSLKLRAALAANVITGALVGFLAIVGSLINETPVLSQPSLLALAVLGGIAVIAREVLDDIADLGGDSNRRRTLPMLIGASSTTLIAAVLLYFASGLLVLVTANADVLAMRLVGPVSAAPAFLAASALLLRRTSAVRLSATLLKVAIMSGAFGLLALSIPKVGVG